MHAIDSLIDAHLAQVEQVRTQRETIEIIARVIHDAIGRGGKLLTMGNGGSAADAQHLAAELVGRFECERGGLPAVALTTDTSILTSIGNDYGFDQVFSRQIEALARPGDVVLGLSTSGNSRNVIEGMRAAKDMECHTVGLLGHDGGRLKDMVDVALIVPSQNTARVQECHILVAHILCALIEAA
ncbi:MAG: D-sedoheptulose 7-phosphate isomerase [Chromatiales bacterium]|jgi:phosphoheptose isomerase|nr:D-sedoheptulose 7-phosphate isomerase [Chromatiales bacterium]MDX9767454.1 D-sedoheptulose 7-phosphate isomerase [Ectothiorhodospiraceae bacterium]